MSVDDPVIQRLRAEAHRFRRDYTVVHGRPPETFIVSKLDYEALYTWAALQGVDPRDMTLMGMRVRPLARLAWDRDQRVMRHYALAQIRRLWVFDTSPLTAPEPTICVTELPRTYGPTLPCACGEVTWDMMTCTVASWRQEPLSRSPLDQRLQELSAEAGRRIADTLAHSDGSAYILGTVTTVIGPPPSPATPPADSETSTDAEWEVGVHAMINEVKRRRRVGA